MSSLSFASSLLIPLMIPWKDNCTRALHRVNLQKSNLQFRVVAQKVHEDLAEAEGLLLVVVDQGLGERRHQTFQNLSFLSLPARGQSSFPGHWRRKAAQPVVTNRSPAALSELDLFLFLLRTPVSSFLIVYTIKHCKNVNIHNTHLIRNCFFFILEPNWEMHTIAKSFLLKLLATLLFKINDRGSPWSVRCQQGPPSDLVEHLLRPHLGIDEVARLLPVHYVIN